MTKMRKGQVHNGETDMSSCVKSCKPLYQKDLRDSMTIDPDPQGERRPVGWARSSPDRVPLGYGERRVCGLAGAVELCGSVCVVPQGVHDRLVPNVVCLAGADRLSYDGCSELSGSGRGWRHGGPADRRYTMSRRIDPRRSEISLWTRTSGQYVRDAGIWILGDLTSIPYSRRRMLNLVEARSGSSKTGALWK